MSSSSASWSITCTVTSTGWTTPSDSAPSAPWSIACMLTSTSKTTPRLLRFISFSSISTLVFQVHSKGLLRLRGPRQHAQRDGLLRQLLQVLCVLQLDGWWGGARIAAGIGAGRRIAAGTSIKSERREYFTSDEQKRITGTYDMLGLNYYTSRFSTAVDLSPLVARTIDTDDAYSKHGTHGADGNPIGINTGTDWLFSYPEGLKNLLMIIKEKYRNPPIYITENGVGDVDHGNLSMEDALNDNTRLTYLQNHIAKLKEAKDLGCNVRGHFTWSLMDNFEWQNGYTDRFGLIYVDRNNGYKRHMKKSARWFAEFNGVASGKSATFAQPQ